MLHPDSQGFEKIPLQNTCCDVLHSSSFPFDGTFQRVRFIVNPFYFRERNVPKCILWPIKVKSFFDNCSDMASVYFHLFYSSPKGILSLSLSLF